MAQVRKLTAEEIQDLKDFIEEYLEFNGRNFYWKRSPARRIKIGQQAGWVNKKGYRCINIKEKEYAEHRLVWLITYDFYPQDEEDIDHVNGIRYDNSLENLRLVSRSCNLQNQCKRKDNSSQIVGVNWYEKNKKWVAQIQIKGKKIHLGYFSDLLQAAYARLAAEILLPDWTCNERQQIVRDILQLNPDFSYKDFNPENRIKNKNFKNFLTINPE